MLVTRTHAFAEALRAGDARLAPARCSRRRARPTRRSSPSRSPSATSTRGSTRASTTSSRARSGPASTRSRSSCGCRHTTRGTAALADGLEADIAHLQSLVKTVKLEPAQIANGATGLLGEVSKSKVTGEEDRYSHTDLSDFAANVDGAAGGVRRHPARARRSATRARDADRRALQDGRRRARRAPRRRRRSSPTTRWAAAQVRALSQAVDALAEPLSQAPGAERSLG